MVSATQPLTLGDSSARSEDNSDRPARRIAQARSADMTTRFQCCLIAADCSRSGLALLLAAGLIAVAAREVLSSPNDQLQTAEAQQASVVQVLRAPDWKGAVEIGDEGCIASHGEYTVWVYAKGSQCGVPREQADRVVVIRQPLPGVAPIRGATHLPGGRYKVWVYGAGDPGHPGLRLCAKICVTGVLSTTPSWVSLGWIDLRDDQLVFLRSWDQPEAHSLYIQAVVLSSSDAQPDWTP